MIAVYKFSQDLLVCSTPKQVMSFADEMYPFTQIKTGGTSQGLTTIERKDVIYSVNALKNKVIK